MNIASEPPASRTPLVLMIDDTPANLGVVAGHLESHGFRVMVAQDGEEGLKRAEFIQPDLILLDVMMPGIDGFETCRLLKASKETREIPVIFMTALGETQDKITGFSVGGVDYLTKPFQIEEVMARVNTHIALFNSKKLLAEQNDQLRQEISMRQQAESALQHANDVLEVRVAERTAELTETNTDLKAEIFEREQAERHIRYMAHHDALTGLPNRLLLEDRLNQAIAQARRRRNDKVAVLFIDLDYFKTINDSLGHPIGDRLLQEAALRLQKCVREGDSVARLGGDEYVMVLATLTDTNDASAVAKKVLEALSLPFAVDGHELHVSGSVGISIFPDDGADVEALMRAADASMYYAKQKGRGNYQFFTTDLNETAQRRLAVANQLRQALANNEFAVYYQPQVAIESGRIFSAEALLRLNFPGQSPISCGEFISIAEETGLILPIGQWVLQQACAQLKRWHEAGHPDMRIAVNLSARQFYQTGLVEIISEALKESALHPGALELEITESMLMQPNQENLTILKQLSAMGVQLSIDDFGTGYSCLAYLQNFPIHALKIDRSFMIRINHDNRHAAIVTAIIAMAHSLSLQVIAEGVDNEEQIAFLKAHGCLAAQGFYYSKPVSAQVFSELLDKACLTPMSGANIEEQDLPATAAAQENSMDAR